MSTPEDPRDESSEQGSHTDEEYSPEERRRRAMTVEFLKEVLILIFGVLVGFFWSQYFKLVDDSAHIVVFLLLIIFCLVRYIYISRR